MILLLNLVLKYNKIIMVISHDDKNRIVGARNINLTFGKNKKLTRPKIKVHDQGSLDILNIGLKDRQLSTPC